MLPACAQVEQLSRIIQMNPNQLAVLKRDERALEDVRLSAINMTVNIDRRLVKLFELVEDLLGRLQCSANYISPYLVTNDLPATHTGASRSRGLSQGDCSMLQRAHILSWVHGGGAGE